MYLGYGILGLIIGALITGGGRYAVMGAVGGAVIGLVLARLKMLEQRVIELESKARLRARRSAHAVESVAAETAPNRSPPEPEATTPPLTGAFEEPQQPHPAAAPLKVRPARKKHVFEKASRPSQPSILQGLLKRLSNWLTTGNIPVKVGVIISFIGVAFLLKYAIDREIVVLSLEMRLVAVALAGVTMLIIGWRLRRKARVYALSMQGGGAGILFLTVFAALRLWQMLPASLAFVLLSVLTLLTGVLAVIQNARTLAILGIVGGFLAPVLTSTGQGSHVVLFSYYLVLNAAILGIAWFRSWRELNLIGFGFTFIIGSLWGYQYYTPELRASTMPFLILHFLFYQVIAILFAFRQSPPKLGVVDGTLVFGTPVIVFALQAALVTDTEYGLAISAAVAAVFYGLVTTWLYHRKQEELRLLMESFLSLAVVFATLTIPLALDARWTSAAWALEGAALIWIGARQGRHLASLAGASLIFLSGLAFLDDGWRSMAGPAVLNGNFIGCLLISVAAFFGSRRLRFASQEPFKPLYRLAMIALFVWAGLWWLGMGWQEIDDRATQSLQSPLMLLFTSLSFLAGAWLARRWQWTLMYRASLLFLIVIAVMMIHYENRSGHFLVGAGWIAWPLAWLVQGWILRILDQAGDSSANDPVGGSILKIWHFLSLGLLTALIALESQWRTNDWVGGAWPGAALSVVPGCMALLVWSLRFRPAWPVPGHPATYRLASIALVMFQVFYLATVSIERPGDPSPLNYLPLLNPYGLAMLFAALTAIVSLKVIEQDTANGAFAFPNLRLYQLFLAGGFLALTTSALIRGVHHYSGVPWDADQLFESVIVQTSLSVYWGVLGFSGMLWGARKSSRLLWLFGAGFMALVVAKLFLIDLGNSGTVERIVSFIAVGALLLVVGYFAPAPAASARQAE